MNTSIPSLLAAKCSQTVVEVGGLRGVSGRHIIVSDLAGKSLLGLQRSRVHSGKRQRENTDWAFLFRSNEIRSQHHVDAAPVYSLLYSTAHSLRLAPLP